MDAWLKKGKNNENEQNMSENSSKAVSVQPGPSRIRSDDSDSNPPKILKKPRKYKFCESWLQDSDLKNWLIKSKDTGRSDKHQAYCKLCKVNILPHKATLLKHMKSSKHKFQAKQVSSTSDLSKMLDQPLSEKTRRAELKLAGLLATNNLPFSLIDVLTPLCQDIFSGSKIAQEMLLHRTKATQLIKEGLAPSFKEEIYSHLRKNGSYFSIIMDETTDSSTKKMCAFAVIFYDELHNNVICRFFDMVEQCSGNADDLFRCLKSTITEKGIPFSNVAGFSADTTNCMFGKDKSVAALLKKDLPSVVCVKCSCHMIHLCASKACMELPRSVEDLLRNIGSHFHRSAQRTDKFKEFQEFFGVDIHKILSPSNTRWLSLKACVDRVLEQFEPLHMYFREYVFSDPSKTTEDMLNTMNNKFTIIYLELMSYVLGLLVDFNVLFQGESPLLHRLKPETERLLKILYSNFLQIEYFKDHNVLEVCHMNPNYFVPLEKIYIGVAATDTLQNLKENVNKADLEQFYKTCLQFYIQLCTQIKKKFKFDDKIFDILSVVEPSVAQSFEIKSLKSVFERFPTLIDYVKSQEVDNEWRQHALLDHMSLGLSMQLTVEEYWKKVFLLKNSAGTLLFPNLKKVITYLLILPFSNASVERIFSHLTNIKTFHRNKLSSENIASLIFTKQGIENIIKFNPSRKMISANIWTKRKE